MGEKIKQKTSFIHFVEHPKTSRIHVMEFIEYNNEHSLIEIPAGALDGHQRDLFEGGSSKSPDESFETADESDGNVKKTPHVSAGSVHVEAKESEIINQLSINLEEAEETMKARTRVLKDAIVIFKDDDHAFAGEQCNISGVTAEEYKKTLELDNTVGLEFLELASKAENMDDKKHVNNLLDKLKSVNDEVGRFFTSLYDSRTLLQNTKENNVEQKTIIQRQVALVAQIQTLVNGTNNYLAKTEKLLGECSDSSANLLVQSTRITQHASDIIDSGSCHTRCLGKSPVHRIRATLNVLEKELEAFDEQSNASAREHNMLLRMITTIALASDKEYLTIVKKLCGVVFKTIVNSCSDNGTILSNVYYTLDKDESFELLVHSLNARETAATFKEMRKSLQTELLNLCRHF